MLPAIVSCMTKVAAIRMSADNRLASPAASGTAPPIDAAANAPATSPAKGPAS